MFSRRPGRFAQGEGYLQVVDNSALLIVEDADQAGGPRPLCARGASRGGPGRPRRRRGRQRGAEPACAARSRAARPSSRSRASWPAQTAHVRLWRIAGRAVTLAGLCGPSLHCGCAALLTVAPSALAGGEQPAGAPADGAGRRPLQRPGDRAVGARRRPRRPAGGPRRTPRSTSSATSAIPASSCVEVEAGQTAWRRARRRCAPTRPCASPTATATSVPHAMTNDPLFGELGGCGTSAAVGIDGFTGALAGADIDALARLGPHGRHAVDGRRRPRLRLPLRPSRPRVRSPGPTPARPAGGGRRRRQRLRRRLHGADFVGANADAPTIDGDPTDDDLISGGHGVHTAGTIGAAGNNGVGITGVAPERADHAAARLRQRPRRPRRRRALPVLLADRSRSTTPAATARAWRTCRSAGPTSTQLVVDAFAANPRTLFVISAGNDGGDNDARLHHYPCDYDPAATSRVAGRDRQHRLRRRHRPGRRPARASPTGARLGRPRRARHRDPQHLPDQTRYRETFTANDFASVDGDRRRRRLRAHATRRR